MFEKVNPSHPDKLCDRIAGKVAVHYVEVAQSGETEAAEFEQFDGDPIKVAVTGALPPMEIVSVFHS